MAYQTYITEALVCGSKDNNTSDRAYLLFTRDGGMVWASARSVRLERSKQRFALQEFSHIRATLIRGKGGWRIAGVESLGNLYFDTQSRAERGLVRDIVRLLRRVMQGETVHAEIYDDVVASLHEGPNYDREALELILAMRILHGLGYVDPKITKARIFDHTFAYEGVQDSTEEQISLYKDTVAHALENSHL